MDRDAPQCHFHQLNVDIAPIPDCFVIDLPAGHPLTAIVPLFRTITPDEVACCRTTYAGNDGGSSTEHTAKNKKKPAAGAGRSAASPVH